MNKLYLERRIGEAVVIELPDGRLVRVVVKATAGRCQVRLGVTADRDVPVMRSELLRPEPAA